MPGSPEYKVFSKIVQMKPNPNLTTSVNVEEKCSLHYTHLGFSTKICSWPTKSFLTPFPYFYAPFFDRTYVGSGVRSQNGLSASFLLLPLLLDSPRRRRKAQKIVCHKVPPPFSTNSLGCGKVGGFFFFSFFPPLWGSFKGDFFKKRPGFFVHVRREVPFCKKRPYINNSIFTVAVSPSLSRSVPNGQKSDPFFCSSVLHVHSPSFRVLLSVVFFTFLICVKYQTLELDRL